MRHIFVTGFILLIFASCASTKHSPSAPSPVTKSDDVSVAPDYSSLIYWAAHPLKHDPSDSVPAFLQSSYTIDSSADVFFIHPTTYTDQTLPLGWNAPILDNSLNIKTDNSTILYQASIFNITGRVFAPRYRQANIHAYYTTDTAAGLKALQFAYADVKKAFEYYLQHENKGRPIIIAAHSQGATQAKWLMRDFFDGKPLQKQLVAAYLVGMPVEPNWFKQIPACTSPTETGCFCSWRTFKKDYVPGYITKEKFTAVVTNPLTWDANKLTAERSENLGGVLLNFNKVVPNVTDATVHKGVLWIDKPHFFGNLLYREKNYHIADYNLFYLNVQQNVKQRLQAFNKINH
jgi:hypothetical protein